VSTAAPEQAGVQPTGSGQPLLSLVGITKSFGAVKALTDIDLQVDAGEVVAIVGDNGAGKSTLVKTLAGVHAPDSGTFLFDGRPVSLSGPAAAIELGIATVFQDLALCENLSVVDNLFLGRELSPFALDETSMEVRSWELLRSLSAKIPTVRIPIASLSGGQRQTVAIARAVLWNSKLVILDEPTAALGVAQTEQVLNLVRRLADNGLAVILITHNMNDVKRVADSVAALYLGRTAAQVDASTVSTTQIVELITAGYSGDIGLPPNIAQEAVA
jgi:D-xylose transport system ATP-binding protein